MTKVTENEQLLMTMITQSEYMDGEGADMIGYDVYEQYVLEDCGFGDGAGGVVASAMKKGFIESYEGDPGYPGTIQLTKKGYEAWKEAAK